MNQSEDNPFPEDFVQVWDEILNDALWDVYYADKSASREDHFHFAPSGTHFVFPDDYLSAEEMYEAAYGEESDSMSWEEYLREESRG
jgi:hypothetical protein